MYIFVYMSETLPTFRFYAQCSTVLGDAFGLSHTGVVELIHHGFTRKYSRLGGGQQKVGRLQTVGHILPVDPLRRYLHTIAGQWHVFPLEDDSGRHGDGGCWKQLCGQAAEKTQVKPGRQKRTKRGSNTFQRNSLYIYWRQGFKPTVKVWSMFGQCFFLWLWETTRKNLHKGSSSLGLNQWPLLGEHWPIYYRAALSWFVLENTFWKAIYTHCPQQSK